MLVIIRGAVERHVHRASAGAVLVFDRVGAIGFDDDVVLSFSVMPLTVFPVRKPSSLYV